MSLTYTAEMMESVKKVEAGRAARIGFEPKRMTAEEKTALLEKFHPDYNLDSFEEIKVGPNKGQKAPKELSLKVMVEQSFTSQLLLKKQ